ncbi:MAG: cupredoxin domain-containing protein [Actinobacteria bacterium]|nr:cupredoxin domain-containing protein [Actinomycetota bacterium]
MRLFPSRLLLAALVAALAAACGGGGGGGGRRATCEPSGTELTVTARNIAFDRGCLAAPAGRAFTIELANRDSGIPHNLSIYVGGKALFEGEIFSGDDSRTYRVPALEAGDYTFVCDVHPEMDGAFVVA